MENVNITTKDNETRNYKGRLIFACQSFQQRAEALSLKGKKRDDAVMNYFVGIAQGAELAGDHDLCQYFGRITGMLLATRGYKYIEQTLNEYNNAHKKTA